MCVWGGGGGEGGEEEELGCVVELSFLWVAVCVRVCVRGVCVCILVPAVVNSVYMSL